MTDLGLVFHEPMKESNGAIVIVCVKSMPSRELKLPISSVGSYSWVSIASIATPSPQVMRVSMANHIIIIVV